MEHAQHTEVQFDLGPIGSAMLWDILVKKQPLNCNVFVLFLSKIIHFTNKVFEGSTQTIPQSYCIGNNSTLEISCHSCVMD